MKCRPATRIVCWAAVFIGIGSDASDVCADSPRHYAGQLAAESDALVRCAVRRPYGWAWDQDASSELTGHPSAHTVTMEPLGTPAAGLVLLLVGKFLNEPRYLEAAAQAARAVAAAQSPTGRVLAHPVFGVTAGGREEIMVIADRTSTCAAIGLLLASIDASIGTPSSGDVVDPHLESVHRSAAKCARWLAKQEAPNGLWPSVYPADATPKTATRLARLDDSDFRDCTFALLLALDLLHDDSLRHFATRPLDGLLKLRLSNDVHGPDLWCTACTVDGSDIPEGFPHGPDLLASRYVTQTLMGGYLFTGEKDLELAVHQAAVTLGQVKRADGLYDRFLNPTAAADIARSIGDEPASQPFFDHPTTRPAPGHSVLATLSTSGSFGIPELLESTGRLKSLEREKYIALMANTLPLHQQIEACLSGLSEDPFSTDFPQTMGEVPAFQRAHPDLAKSADSPPPQDLAGRVKRLWTLYLLARLERIGNPNSS